MRRTNVYNALAHRKCGIAKSGSVAQLVEQRIENPRVGGSIPSRAIIFLPKFLTLPITGRSSAW